MINVKRLSDGKIFTSDMSAKDVILEIHFCTSYTQVVVQESTEDGLFKSSNVICEAEGTKASWVDLIAIQEDEKGEFVEHLSNPDFVAKAKGEL